MFAVEHCLLVSSLGECLVYWTDDEERRHIRPLALKNYVLAQQELLGRPLRCSYYWGSHGLRVFVVNSTSVSIVLAVAIDLHSQFADVCENVTWLVACQLLEHFYCKYGSLLGEVQKLERQHNDSRTREYTVQWEIHGTPRHRQRLGLSERVDPETSHAVDAEWGELYTLSLFEHFETVILSSIQQYSMPANPHFLQLEPQWSSSGFRRVYLVDPLLWRTGPTLTSESIADVLSPGSRLPYPRGFVNQIRAVWDSDADRRSLIPLESYDGSSSLVGSCQSQSCTVFMVHVGYMVTWGWPAACIEFQRTPVSSDSSAAMEAAVEGIVRAFTDRWNQWRVQLLDFSIRESAVLDAPEDVSHPQLDTVVPAPTAAVSVRPVPLPPSAPRPPRVPRPGMTHRPQLPLKAPSRPSTPPEGDGVRKGSVVCDASPPRDHLLTNAQSGFDLLSVSPVSKLNLSQISRDESMDMSMLDVGASATREALSTKENVDGMTDRKVNAGLFFSERASHLT